MPYVPRTVWCCHHRSPRWIFVAWHWNFAWYVFVRAALGDVNSHTGIFRQDACILYITLMMLYLCRRPGASLLYLRATSASLLRAVCT